ncbi:MAG: YvcK family protein [Candidatus Sungbacteria bacterium]|nr:YvcK family protein [Candidatus Sungbacteria bacterium]
MKNIVIIGGGTGTFTLLAGLRKFPSNNSVIVSPADDGGSTGVLRRELGVMPPGDIRQCLVGLSYTESEMRELFSYRFASGSLKGHTVGNIIIAAFEKITGSSERAIALAAKMLNVRGEVIPAMIVSARLSATLKNGSKIIGEHAIDEPMRPRTSPIASLALTPASRANPRAIAAIKKADAIVFGPGDLFTSILPNILARGMREAIVKSSAQKILVVNIMTKRGQTDDFRASDFIATINTYLAGGKIKSVVDTAIVNMKKPNPKWLARYKKEGALFVEPNTSAIEAAGTTVITGDFLSPITAQKTAGDTLARSFLRHDSDKTARAIWKLIS